ncbi:MAG TPA: hypothetical protein VGY66_08660, partial [Gemmataceae bacterium]|nr:hypothetical protein [Gemmataceae bacterium]
MQTGYFHGVSDFSCWTALAAGKIPSPRQWLLGTSVRRPSWSWGNALYRDAPLVPPPENVPLSGVPRCPLVPKLTY